MGTTTQQLQRWADKHIPKRNRFIGIFAEDKLPTRVRGPCCMVLNYGKSTGDRIHGKIEYGMHWTAVVVDGNNHAEWIDSMGEAPDGDDYAWNIRTKFKMWLRTTFRGYSYSPTRLQSYGSGVCGQYSLFACLVMGSVASRPDAYAWASEEYRRNDQIIRGKVRID